MPKKLKPSEWKPKGLDVSPEVSRLYPQDVLDSIIEQAGVHDRAARERLRQAVDETVTWLYLDLHYQGRPTTKIKQASLHKLKDQVIHLRLTLRRLDPDTNKTLETEADRDPVNLSIEPSGGVFNFHGDIRMAEVKRGLARLSKWVRLAEKTLGKAKSGRPKKKSEFQAVCRLAVAWTEAHGGITPTRQFNSPKSREEGPFRKFANDALSPLGVSVSDDMAKRAIEWTNDISKMLQEE